MASPCPHNLRARRALNLQEAIMTTEEEATIDRIKKAFHDLEQSIEIAAKLGIETVYETHELQMFGSPISTPKFTATFKKLVATYPNEKSTGN